MYGKRNCERTKRTRKRVRHKSWLDKRNRAEMLGIPAKYAYRGRC